MEKQEEIFILIINAFQDKIFRLCWTYTRNKYDCEDLVQDIYVKIWRNLKYFKNDSKIATWIYRVAVNNCIDFIRNKKNKNVLSYEKADKLKSVNSGNDIEEEYIKSENLRMLHQSIQGLNEIERIIIALYLEELKYSEIAAIMGISEKNVGVKITRIKKRLKKLL